MLDPQEQRALDELYRLVAGEAWPSTEYVPLPVEKACSILAATRQPGEVLTRLAFLTWHAEGGLRAALARLLFHLAENLNPAEWPRTDEGIRQHWDSQPSSHGSPELASDPAATLIALCHPWGKWREAALEAIRTLPRLVADALLLVRVNDWVPTISSQAARMLQSRMKLPASTERIALAPLVWRLRQCGRHRVSPEVDGWFGKLAECFEEETWFRLWDGSQGEDRKVYLELLKRADPLPGRALSQRLLASNDRVAITWFLRRVVPRLDIEARAETFAILASCQAVPIRKLWLAQQLETGAPQALGELVTALTHRSRSLREFARYHLARIAPMDFAGHYEAALGGPSVEPWALRGLAEVSPAAGHREALLRLDSSDPRIKRAAIECLDAERLGDHLDYLLREIQTWATGPGKAARKRLNSIIADVGAELVAEPSRFFSMAPGAREYLLSLAPLYRKWNGLELLLRAAADPQGTDIPKQVLPIWLSREGRSFIRLASRKRCELLDLLEAAKLPHDLAKRLRYVLERAEA